MCLGCTGGSKRSLTDRMMKPRICHDGSVLGRLRMDEQRGLTVLAVEMADREAPAVSGL